MKYIKLFCFISIGILSLVASIWEALWIFSSASLASDFCKSNFGLFHENFRCRQPYPVIIAALIFMSIFLGCAYLSVRTLRHGKV